MKKTFLSCFVLLFSVSIIAQNSVSLKLNLEKNKVYRLNTVSEQTIIQTVNGNQQTVESRTNYTASIKMVDATTDFMVTEIHFDSLITNTNTMGKTVNISSVSEGDIKSAETDLVMSYIMNRLSKNALYAKMDFSGKVIDIVNAKMVSDLIMKDTTLLTLTGPVRAAVISQIKNLVTARSLTTMIEMFTHFIPGRQVSTGESWNVSEITNSGGMSLDIETGYHLDGISGNNANITAESNIKAAANAVPMQSGPATVTYDDLKGLSKSSIVIDIRTGLLVEDNAKTHITGNLGVSGPGFSMQIPMDISGESKVISLK
jgi:hypothetical protein